MGYHDEISSYIDNELSREQEQEFLISLAANENLRKAFRSELVLKNVLHQDERLTAPPREMRGAVLAALGIGVAADALGTAHTTQQVVSASTSPAAPTSFFKTLFATKVNTLLTTASLICSATVGFVTHAVVQPADHPQQVIAQPAGSSAVHPATQTPVFQKSETSTVATPLANETTESAPSIQTPPATSKGSEHPIMHANAQAAKSTAQPSVKPGANAAATDATSNTKDPQQTINVGDIQADPVFHRK